MAVTIRPITAEDETIWRKHWHAYNEFYKRVNEITEEITATTFKRFLDPKNPIDCAVAVLDNDQGSGAESGVVGFATYFPHPSTYTVEDHVYLNDLFVDPSCRNGGIGRKLIEYVYSEADKAGYKVVYWHTQYFNHRAQLLYTKVGKRTDFIMYARE
jgi:D-amino-acid N-acetyltransferase